MSRKLSRKKHELRRDVVRLTAELARTRSHIDDLIDAARVTQDNHRAELMVTRYRTMLELMDRQEAGTAFLGAVVSDVEPVVVEVTREVVVGSSEVVDVLQAQVADLQQRLTDAQRTIEMLVARVLEISQQSEVTPQLSVVREASGDVKTLRFPLQRGN